MSQKKDSRICCGIILYYNTKLHKNIYKNVIFSLIRKNRTIIVWFRPRSAALKNIGERGLRQK